MTLLKIWSSGRSVLGRRCFGLKYFRAEVFPAWSISGLKYFRAEVGIGPKYYLGRSIPWAKLCLWPKHVWGQSDCGAKVVLGPHWVWACKLSTIKSLKINLTSPYWLATTSQATLKWIAIFLNGTYWFLTFLFFWWRGGDGTLNVYVIT